MRLSFRVALNSILVGLLTCTVAILGGLSYWNARTGARELARQVLGQAMQRAELRIRGFLGVAQETSALSLRLLRSGQLAPTDFPRLAAFWLQVMEIHPELSFLSFGIEGSGDYLCLERQPGGRLSVRELRRTADGRLTLDDFWPSDYAARRAYNHKDDHEPGNPTKRPWFLLAKAARHPVWSPTYTFIGEGGVETVTGITFSSPLFREDGSLVGVMTADFDVFAISKFLAENPIGKAGSGFVVEQGEPGAPMRVVAHPRPEIITRASFDAQGIKRYELVPASELGDSRVAELMRQVAPPGSEPVDLTADGARFLGTCRWLEGDEVPRWIVCGVLPRSEVMARVERAGVVAIAIGVGSFVLALLLGVWTSVRVSRPLARVAQQAQAIGRFELDGPPLEGSSIREIDQLVLATEDMKAGLRSFGKFVPAALVREILGSGVEARPGGRRARLTMFFSDLAGFTTIAEQMPAEALAEHLGEYLEEMSQALHAEQGTIERFIGDGIGAFFGAPRPLEHHALAACRAALACQKRLAALRDKWRVEGKPELFARIGLNTGEVVVGNFGSASMLSYSVNGDAVNLASRLEGLNKRYRTAILMGEATFREVEADVVARPIDRVAVKGRAHAVTVYELVGLRAEVTPEARQATELYAAGLERFLARRFDEALARFEQVLKLHPDDEPARQLSARCAALLAMPPSDDWDGTVRLDEK